MLGTWEGTQGGLSVGTLWKFAWERKMPSHIQLTEGCLKVLSDGVHIRVCDKASLLLGSNSKLNNLPFFILRVPPCQGTQSRKGRVESEGNAGRVAQITEGLSPSPRTRAPSPIAALQRGMAGGFPLGCLSYIFYTPPRKTKSNLA